MESAHSQSLDQTDSSPLAPIDFALFQFVVAMTWATIMKSKRINGLFKKVFNIEDHLLEVATSAGLHFCSGLLDTLQSPTAPPLQFFLNLPTAPATTSNWAVYALVLSKPGFQSLVYISSGTSWERGILGRFRSYINKTTLPTYVEQALHDGYTIQHKGLLV